jgi:hypothetical protein
LNKQHETLFIRPTRDQILFVCSFFAALLLRLPQTNGDEYNPDVYDSSDIKIQGSVIRSGQAFPSTQKFKTREISKLRKTAMAKKPEKRYSISTLKASEQ